MGIGEMEFYNKLEACKSRAISLYCEAQDKSTGAAHRDGTIDTLVEEFGQDVVDAMIREGVAPKPMETKE